MKKLMIKFLSVISSAIILGSLATTSIFAHTTFNGAISNTTSYAGQDHRSSQNFNISSDNSTGQYVVEIYEFYAGYNQRNTSVRLDIKHDKSFTDSTEMVGIKDGTVIDFSNFNNRHKLYFANPRGTFRQVQGGTQLVVKFVAKH